MVIRLPLVAERLYKTHFLVALARFVNDASRLHPEKAVKGLCTNTLKRETRAMSSVLQRPLTCKQVYHFSHAFPFNLHSATTQTELATMTELPTSPNCAIAAKHIDESPAVLSKKALKKAEAKKAKKENQIEQQQSRSDIANKIALSLADSFGYLTLSTLPNANRSWAHLRDLNNANAQQHVWIRCRIHESRCKGALGFLVLREGIATIQAVLSSKTPELGRDAVKWAASVPLESVVDVYGTVVVPETPIMSTTQSVEIHIEKLFCISKASSELPFMLRDANRPEDASDSGDICVKLDTRLDNRVLDLRTTTNAQIFRIQSAVGRFFREHLYANGFLEIHTPKIIGGAAEGGASVFTLSYFGRKACMAQSPQLHKQMAICGDMDRVFEIGPVFRAENSNTHRHLCEFTGLDFEMAIRENYQEVLDMLDNTLKEIFKRLAEKCAEAIKAVHAQYPATPFTWIAETPKLTFYEGIEMLREAGYTDIPDDVSSFDLSTTLEKALGRLVKDKYKTDYYMLIRYPLNVRPFYTMPCSDDPTLSNSYDVFMRGEEIVSGAQRIHEPELLIERAQKWEIPLESIQSYIDAFKLGAFPHGGCGIGLERVVMLFLGLDNIRKTSMFPRDPKRLHP